MHVFKCCACSDNQNSWYAQRNDDTKTARREKRNLHEWHAVFNTALYTWRRITNYHSFTFMEFQFTDSTVPLCSWYSYQATDWTTRGLMPSKGTRFLSSPQNAGQIWGPPSLIFNGHHRIFPQWLSSQDVNTHTHILLVLWLQISGAIHLLPIYAFTVCMWTFTFPFTVPLWHVLHWPNT